MTIEELRNRLSQIRDVALPKLQQQVAEAKAKRAAAEEQLRAAGWDSEEKIEDFLLRLQQKQQDLRAKFEAAVQEAEDAIRSLQG